MLCISEASCHIHFRLTFVTLFPGGSQVTTTPRTSLMSFPVHWTEQYYRKWRICSGVYVLCRKKKIPLLSQTAVLITWCSHKKFLVRTILNGYPREKMFRHGISFRSSNSPFHLVQLSFYIDTKIRKIRSAPVNVKPQGRGAGIPRGI